jgi:hypothetical protein
MTKPNYVYTFDWSHPMLKRITWFSIMTSLITYILSIIAYLNPEFTEKYYSGVVYPVISLILHSLTKWFTFSLGEILLVTAVISVTVLFFYGVFCLIIKRQLKPLLILLNSVLIIYSSFMWSWGFNYYRSPITTQLNYDTSNFKHSELMDLCISLIQDANNLRQTIPSDDLGIAVSFKSKPELISEGKNTLPYVKSLVKTPSFSVGHIKKITLSYPMLYTGIVGIYFPFTAEANVNTAVPDLFFTSTVIHEAAHLLGYAFEDEANFLAYYGSIHSENHFVAYSGTLLALVHSMNALYAIDPDDYFSLLKYYSESVVLDLKEHSNFWKTYEGKVRETSDSVNDSYLKLNRQKDGVKSYGRMVDLLIAYKRSLKNS